ncbi:MAG: gamma-glutamylcyclotransferase family protein [Pseudolabrys sp.]
MGWVATAEKVTDHSEDIALTEPVPICYAWPMLYFAYGSNMDRDAMAARCREARALGAAALPGWRFFIGAEGWGSVDPAPGCTVHGVLWRLSLRDAAALHTYELLHTGLYDVRTLPVLQNTGNGAKRVPAMTYVLRRRVPGEPKPGYIEMIVRAARDWNLPERYVATVARRARSGWTGQRTAKALAGRAVGTP